MKEFMLHGIVFDMDGVIIDSHPFHRQAWQQFLLTLGRQVSEKDLECILEGWRREDILRHFLGNLTQDQIAEYGDQKDRFFQKVSLPVKPVSGVRQFLEHLATLDIPKAVATSASERRTRLTLERLQLSKHFAAIVTANDVEKGKPDPAIYRLAASRMGIAPQHIAAVEDSVSGVKAARSAGMRCLGIAANGRSQLLLDAGAHKVVRNFVGLSLGRLESMLTSSVDGKKPQALLLECS